MIERVRGSGLIASLVLLGCTSTETVVVAEPPIDASLASLLIVFEGETSFVYAIDVATRAQPLLQIDAPGWTESEFTAVAFGFDRPLSFYGLSPGLLRPVDGPRSCALGSPSTAALYDPNEERWSTLDPPTHESIVELSDEATHGCTPIDSCRRFQSEVIELDTPDNVHFLLPLDERTALIGTSGGRFYEATREAITERPDLAGLPSSSAMILPSKEIWLGGDGVVARGTRAGSFVEMEMGGERVGAVAVRGEGTALEVLAVSVGDIPDIDTSTVVVHRFAGGTWTEIDRRIEEDATFRHCDIQWFGDRAVILFGAIRGLVWDGVRMTSFALDSPIPLFEPHLNDLATREDFGTVMATNDGFLYQVGSDPTAWTAIADAALGNTIDAVAPVFEGFLFGGPDGTVNQFYPESVPCSSERLVASDVERIVQLGEHILVSGGNPDRSQPNTVTWLSE